MKLNQLKTRLVISVATGILAVLIYNSLLAEVKPAEIIGISNFLNALWKRFPEIQIFLFFFAFILIVVSIPVLFKKGKFKEVIVSVSIGVLIVVTTLIFEFRLRQKKLAYNTLDTAQVMKLYEKAIKTDDIDAIVTIALHPNLPDSIQKKLSDSEFMEIRRNIAYETGSEEILKNSRLSFHPMSSPGFIRFRVHSSTVVCTRTPEPLNP